MSTDDIPEMPFLRNIGLVVTYKCQVACPHCIIEAGPHRKEEMLLDDALNWIQQIANYRNGYTKVLSLTGGEPFYNLANLKKMAAFGNGKGLLVSAVTNVFWAKTKDKAVDILKSLPDIRMLAISTDVYHQESIPFERVENAVFAAEKLDVPFNISVCTESMEDEEYRRVMEELETIADPDLINSAITFPVGRALKKINKFRYRRTKEPPISACAAGSSPVVFPDGRVIGCIGPVIDLKSPHPLVLGNLRERTMKEILDDAELNPVLHAIRIWGPKKLISLIEDGGLEDNLPDEYIKDSVCNACYSLMKNGRIAGFLEQMANGDEFVQKVAYGRVYYLKEKRMAEVMGLGK